VAMNKIRFFSDIPFGFNSVQSLSVQRYVIVRTLRNVKKGE